ncbi:transporter substrate-binding domain-containing protein [Peptoniphilus raoultii]|uniref:transporter substrate-binding domain-containing protein n=1 Tax=Peptoniphilus raoultii TaxID=1776387 RepID=UPI0008DA6AC4|nr:transporter substrate-binding domain-containing protein [Peptoniphilus raoultii]
MKRLLTSILILCLTLTLVACGGNKTQGDSANANVKSENQATGENTKEGAEATENASDSSLEDVKAKGKIVVGTSADFPPMEWVSYKDGGEKYLGLDMNIAQAIADKLGVELEIKNMAFEGLLASLKAGDVDIVLAGMEASDDRKKEVDFSAPYYSGGQVIVVREEDKDLYKTLDDLKGKKVGTQINTVQQTYAEEMFGSDAQAYDLNNVLIEQLKNKSVDAIFLSELPAKEFVYLNEGLAVIEDVGAPKEKGFAVAIKKGNNSLLDEVSKIVSELKDSGQVDKWLDENIELSHQEVSESK